jgi:cell division septation protein DedD
MRKFFTPLSSGQLSFFLLSIIASSAIFFYLGARFGAKVNQATDTAGTGELILLPDERLEQEIEQILAQGDADLRFHELLQGDAPMEGSLPNGAPKTDAIDHDERLKKLSKNQLTDTTPKVSDPPEPGPELGKAAAQQDPPVNDLTWVADEGAVSVPAAIKFRLQVGSYAELAKAKADMAAWKKRGYDVKLITAAIPGKGTWYRLQVGRYASMEDVRAAQGKIMKEYGKTAMIMPGE